MAERNREKKLNTISWTCEGFPTKQTQFRKACVPCLNVNAGVFFDVLKGYSCKMMKAFLPCVED